MRRTTIYPAPSVNHMPFKDDIIELMPLGTSALDMHPHLRKHIVNQTIAGLLAYLVVHVTHLLTKFILSGILGFRAVLYSHKVDLRLSPGGLNLGTLTLLYNGIFVVFILLMMWFASQTRRPPIGIPFLRQVGFWLRFFAFCYICGGLISDALMGDGLAYTISLLGIDKRLLYAIVPIMLTILAVNLRNISFWLCSTSLCPIDEENTGDYIKYVGLVPLVFIAIISVVVFGAKEYRMLGMLGAAFIALLILLSTWHHYMLPSISRTRINKYGIAWPIFFFVLFTTCLMVVGRFRGISSTRFFTPISTTVLR